MLVAGSKSATLMGMGIPTFLLGYIIIYENINDTMYDSTNESGVQGGFPQWITISKNLPEAAFQVFDNQAEKELHNFVFYLIIYMY